jgi:molecular chaperone Hsp33
MLSLDDLKDMEGEGKEVVCQYCNKKETISKEEVEQIVMEAQAKMN